MQERSELTKVNDAPSVFIKKDIAVLYHVDDLFFFLEQKGTINKINGELEGKFRIKDMEHPKRIPSLEVKWHFDGSLSMQ